MLASLPSPSHSPPPSHPSLPSAGPPSSTPSSRPPARPTSAIPFPSFAAASTPTPNPYPAPSPSTPTFAALSAAGPASSARTLARLRALPPAHCDLVLVAARPGPGADPRPEVPVLAAVAAAGCDAVRRFLLAAAEGEPVQHALRAPPEARKSFDVPVASRAALDAFVAVLYADFATVAEADTRTLWDVAAVCRELRVVESLVASVEEEVARRDDAVDVDRVFEALGGTGVGLFDVRGGAAGGVGLSGGERAQLMASRKFVRERFCEICEGEAWGRQSASVVERVLRLNDLRLPRGELDVFFALLRWARVPGNSHADAVRLLRLVRFPTMSDRDLLNAVRCDVFAGDDVFYRMILEAFVRRAEVRVLYKPRNEARRATEGAPKYGSAVSEALLIHRSSPNAPVSHARLNARGVRTAAFKGMFPLPLYRHMRFRRRSESGLLFTAVLPAWKSARERIRTESRSFLDHRWSIWIDPVVDAEDSGVPRQGSGRSIRATGNSSGNLAPDDGEPTSTAETTGYMSMYLCCHSDLADGDRSVNVTVDYSLFVASSADPFVMERKVCPAKSFTSHGQASGFRLHTRRALVTTPEAGLYNESTDELVVGAHIVALPTAPNPDILEEPDEASVRHEPPTDQPVGTAYELQKEALARKTRSLPPPAGMVVEEGRPTGASSSAAANAGSDTAQAVQQEPASTQRAIPGALLTADQRPRALFDSTQPSAPRRKGEVLERDGSPPKSPGAGSTMSA